MGKFCQHGDQSHTMTNDDYGSVLGHFGTSFNYGEVVEVKLKMCIVPLLTGTREI